MLRLSLLIVAVLAAVPSVASARTGPCLPDRPDGPRCVVWTGEVDFVADGDTLDVDLAGDGTHRLLRVRITGLQAMEQSVYARDPRRRRGECHALAATRRLERLVQRSRGRVRLAAQDPSSRSKTRARRSVAVRSGGRWRDVNRTLVAEGHALWLPNQTEWAWNAELGRLTDEAARRGRNLWDTDACGRGPDDGRALTLAVNWDADGNDGANVNGEWFRIDNRDGAAADVGGWWVRDSHLRRFRFPAGTTVPARGALRVRVGRGGGPDLHWGLDAPAFENVDPSRGMGDGGYLFDPDGDLRAWMTYR